MKPLDPLVYLAAAVLSAAGIVYSFSGDQGSSVSIRTPRAEYRYSLRHDRVVEVQGQISRMKLEIKAGRARVLETGCPGQVCRLRGWIFRSGDAAVCVPNRVIMKIQGKGQELDGIAE